MKWVKLNKYCELSGDTADGVYNRRRNGVWLDGQECKLVHGSLWINIEAVEKWIEKTKVTQPRAA